MLVFLHHRFSRVPGRGGRQAALGALFELLNKLHRPQRASTISTSANRPELRLSFPFLRELPPAFFNLLYSTNTESHTPGSLCVQEKR
jgi:hypothetical protein